MSAAASALRASLAVAGLALRRARWAPARWVPATIGVAAAVALLGFLAGSGAVAGEQAAQRLLGALPAAQRAVQVTWSGGLPQGVASRARAALGQATHGARTESVLLRASQFGARRTLIRVAGITPLGRWVRLEEGRAPRGCTRKRCELVQVGGPPVPRTLSEGGQAVVVVGRGRLASDVPLGFVPAPTAPDLAPSERQPPLLVGADPGAIEALPALSSVYRTHSWSAPLTVGPTPSWRYGALAHRVTRARARLEAAATGYTVAAPLRALERARARAHASVRRVLLLGGSAAALLAAFALVAAGALRRDLADEERRLQRLGARGWQIGLLAAAEAAAPAALGAVVGAVGAVAAVAVRASGAGIEAGPLLRHALVNRTGLLALVACWLVAGALLVAGTRRWGAAGGRAGDALAVGAAGALALALGRGDVTAGSLAGGDDPLAALLPVLACLVGGLVVARVAGPALRAVARAGRRLPVPTRVAFAGLARAPRQAALTIAFLAVSGGLACFAATYAASLRAGQGDEAAQRVPLDLTVTAGPQLAGPLALASLAHWRGLVPGGSVLPVLRDQVTVPREATRIGLPVLGVPAEGLALVHGWRDGDASAGRAEMARRLSAARPARAFGEPLPAGTGRLELRARSRGDALELTVHLTRGDGSPLALRLGTVGPRARTLVRPVPSGIAGARAVALSARPRSGLLATRGHNLAENPSAPGLVAAMLELGPLRALGTGTPVTLPIQDWLGRGAFGAPHPRPGGGALIQVVFDSNGPAVLRPPASTDGVAVPVLADPRTARAAARDGVLPLNLTTGLLRARVVGTVERFPTVGPGGGGFIVADEETLQAALSADAPGLAVPRELWIATPSAQGERRLAQALGRAPLDALTLRSRGAIEARLRADPLARELLRALAVSALVALALSTLGLALATALTLRDERADLLDLEAQGTEPRSLRGTVRLRVALMTGGGLVCALALGLLVAALVVGALRATATASEPVPPLATVLPWGQWAVGAALFAGAALGTVWLLTRRAFGAALPLRGGDG